MPDLDVTEILFDPDLADTFTVRRQTETVGVNGRSSVAVVDTPNVIGFVIVSDPSDNVRNEDGQMTPRVIDVVTTYRLRAAGTNIQPDIIIWAGTNYLVKQIKPHTRFGAGFVKVTAQSQSAADAPMV